MMECRVILGSGRVFDLPRPEEWTFRYATGTPCDSFTIRCPWEGGQEELFAEISRFQADWAGERVFTGVVDECRCGCGGEGKWLELSGRGMAALLLDNEAMPAQYQRAALADILADHVTPYGIVTVGGGALPAVSGFEVGSGVSEWSVLWDFACYHGGVVPRFDRRGRLVLEGHKNQRALTLDGRTAVTAWEYRDQRHGVLSQAAVRRRTAAGVQWVRDEDFIAQGGCARRVVTVPNTTAGAAMRYSADWQLKASRRDRVRLTVTLPGAFAAWPGELVAVSRADMGPAGEYRVAESTVKCGARGLSTTLELAPPDVMI